ncbi:hypothetical protein DFQ01_12570 [Paenibacillus cellulosilyticus]|uniref:Sporulation lipoprotein YhcN/YlaJ n=1 Tax=Paenibacillus cellulosilyticus TaxID=375489 RepID=A0A2V2YQ96_9BACL|nr:hypothetical protein [Paenibacillus cellulosilyticus]PWV95724.1 hypothetical protein DFQ01_12570 [Paenibacillus cellulosilyticus]QKS47642.1 hypothetical protein HUB94_25100 [Paenibacillus cellulosilyticus]
MRKWFSASASSRIFALLLGVAVLSSGCSSYKYEPHGYKSNSYGTRNGTERPLVDDRARSYGALSTASGNHDNKYFEYSSKISKEVGKINGISTALVMLTNQNAYVAIVFNDTAIRTKSGGRSKHEQYAGSAKEGIYNYSTNSPNWDNRELATPYGHAMTVNDHTELPNALKYAVATKVRKFAPRAKNVYISANSQFVNRFVAYAQKAWLNESLTPFVVDFNALVSNQFGGSNKLPTSTDKINPNINGTTRNNGQTNAVEPKQFSSNKTGSLR